MRFFGGALRLEENRMKVVGREETTGQRIKAQRLRQGLTQQELAEQMMIPKSTVSAYENDKINIKSSVVTELSKLLDTDPNYLLGAESADNDFVKEIGHYLNRIKDKTMQEMLMRQVRGMVEFE